MSKEMREQIDRVKNWKQFLNENIQDKLPEREIKYFSWILDPDFKTYKQMKYDEKMERLRKDEEKYNLIIERVNGNIAIYKKQRPKVGDLPSKKPKTIFYKPEYSSGNGTAQLKEIFGEKVFNNPKPIDLIKDFISIASPKDGIILDFTAGSGTTVNNKPTALLVPVTTGGASCVEWVYRATNTTWYRVQ